MSDKKGQVTVANTEDLQTALAAGYTGDQIVIASNDAAIAQARAAGEEAGRAHATEAAVRAERTRIAEIHALTREGFAAEAQAAIDHGDTPAAFALTLLKAAQDRGITLDAIRKDAPKAAAHARPGDDGAPDNVVKLSSKKIFESRRKAAAEATQARK